MKFYKKSINLSYTFIKLYLEVKLLQCKQQKISMKKIQTIPCQCQSSLVKVACFHFVTHLNLLTAFCHLFTQKCYVSTHTHTGTYPFSCTHVYFLNAALQAVTVSILQSPDPLEAAYETPILTIVEMVFFSLPATASYRSSKQSSQNASSSLGDMLALIM